MGGCCYTPSPIETLWWIWLILCAVLFPPLFIAGIVHKLGKKYFKEGRTNNVVSLAVFFLYGYIHIFFLLEIGTETWMIIGALLSVILPALVVYDLTKWKWPKWKSIGAAIVVSLIPLAMLLVGYVLTISQISDHGANVISGEEYSLPVSNVHCSIDNVSVTVSNKAQRISYNYNRNVSGSGLDTLEEVVDPNNIASYTIPSGNWSVSFIGEGRKSTIYVDKKLIAGSTLNLTFDTPWYSDEVARGFPQSRTDVLRRTHNIIVFTSASVMGKDGKEISVMWEGRYDNVSCYNDLYRYDISLSNATCTSTIRDIQITLRHNGLAKIGNPAYNIKNTSVSDKEWILEIYDADNKTRIFNEKIDGMKSTTWDSQFNASATYHFLFRDYPYKYSGNNYNSYSGPPPSRNSSYYKYLNFPKFTARKEYIISVHTPNGDKIAQGYSNITIRCD